MNIEEILAAMEAITDKAETETRALNDDEIVQYETLEADLKKAQKTVELRARQEAYKAPNTAGAATNAVKAKDGEESRAAYVKYLRGDKSAESEQYRAQSTSTTAGGYTTHKEFLQRLVDRRKAFGGLAAVANNIVTETGNTIEWPTLDDTANTSVIAAEGSAAGSAGADLVFGQKTLAAFKYTSTGTGNAPLLVSRELVQDSSFDVEAIVENALTKRILRKQASDFAAGVGVTMPLGITNTTGDKFVASGLNNIPTYQNLLQVYHAVDPEYRTNSVWVMNDATLAKVQSAVDTTGRPLWTEHAKSGMENISDGQLFGKPVVIDPSFPDLDKDHNGLVFGDMNEAYVIRHVADPTILVDPYTNINKAQIAYTAFARADGTIQNRNAYATLSGGLT